MTTAWSVLAPADTQQQLDGWRVARLKDVVALMNGFAFDSSTFGPTGDVPLVRIRDLNESEFSTHLPGPVPSAALLRDGDIVVGMDGDFNVVWWERGPAALNQRLCALRAQQGVDARFIYYALPRITKTINDLTYFTTVKHLSSLDLLRERLLLPGYEEQQRRSRYLDRACARIDELVAEQRRLMGLLLERRRTSVLDAVTGGSVRGPRHSGPSWASSIPASWPVRRLTRVTELGSGHTPSRSRPELWMNCTIPWITTGEVAQIRSDLAEVLTDTREKISERGIAESSATLRPAGTVVLCRTAASAGFSALMGSDMTTSQDFATWTCGPLLDPYFLLYCLRAMRPDLMGRLAMGSTHKTIYMPEIRSIEVPLPPVEEQLRIVATLKATLAAIDEMRVGLERQIDLLQEHKQALITAVVTGEKEVA